MIRSGTTVLAVIAICCGAVSGPARADDPDTVDKRATELVEKAAELGRKGKLPEAIAAFKEAEQLQPRAINDCNIGLAYVRLERWPQAQLFLSRCRERWTQEQTKPIEEWVNRRLREAIAKLDSGPYAAVTFSSEPVGATITVLGFGADESFTAPRVIWLDAGTAELDVRLAGHTPESRRLTITKGQGQEVRFQLSKAVETTNVEPQPAEPVTALPPSPPTSVPEVTSASQPGPDVFATPVARPSIKPPVWPWVVAGGGALFVGGGILAHFSALSAKTEAESYAPGEDFTTWNERFEFRRAVTFGLYGLGAVALGTGIYFGLRRESKQAPSFAIGVQPTAAGIPALTVTGSWR